MEAATVHEILLNLATNSPFVAFLIWNWWISRKDMESYRLEIKELRSEAKAEEDRIRSRFEEVITDLQKDRDQLVTGLEKRITALDSKTVSLEKAIKKLFGILDRLKDQINELKIKEEVRSLKNG